MLFERYFVVGAKTKNAMRVYKYTRAFPHGLLESRVSGAKVTYLFWWNPITSNPPHPSATMMIIVMNRILG